MPQAFSNLMLWCRRRFLSVCSLPQALSKYFEFLKFWRFEILDFCKFEFLKFWCFESFNFWRFWCLQVWYYWKFGFPKVLISESLNFRKFELLKVLCFESLSFREFDFLNVWVFPTFPCHHRQHACTRVVGRIPQPIRGNNKQTQ